MLKRTLIKNDPVITKTPDFSLPYSENHLRWQCRWLGSEPSSRNGVQATIYRLDFDWAGGPLRFHVSGAERYEFFVDGELLGAGPERGDYLHWAFETFAGTLAKGKHRFTARVWSAFDRAPNNQMPAENRFMLQAEGKADAVLSTGSASWMALSAQGLTFDLSKPLYSWGVLDEVRYDLAKYDERFDRGEVSGFKKAIMLEHPVSGMGAGHRRDKFMLLAAELPLMLRRSVKGFKVCFVDDGKSERFYKKNHLPEYVVPLQKMLDSGTPFKLAAGKRIRAFVNLGNYYCPFVRATLAGAGEVKTLFTEGFFADKDSWEKGDRNDFEGKLLRDCHYDVFVAGGTKKSASTVWHRAGKWLVLEIEAENGGLVLHDLQLTDTHYPLKITGKFAASDPFFAKLRPMMERTLEMCMHEVYYDCPYYEQMMYVGDTRLQVLMSLVLSGDARLPHKALKLFDWSRDYTGFTTACYPANWRMTIPPFSLAWVAMVRDVALWTMGREVVGAVRPGAHAVMDAWESYRQSNDLVVSPPGWNFYDWVTWPGVIGDENLGKEKVPPWGVRDGIAKWHCAVPKDGHAGGFNALANLFYLHVLQCAMEIEKYCGEPAMVELYAARAARSKEAINKHFFDAKRGCYSDDLLHEFRSEHVQSFAIITGVTEGKRLRDVEKYLFDGERAGRAEATVYFNHYYFEACKIANRPDKFLERQHSLWSGFLALGLNTTLESPEPSRSDCHAFGAHLLLHWRTLLLGIEPVAPEFRMVKIQPRLGSLESVSGEFPTPHGKIVASFERKKGKLTGTVSLPAGITKGIFVDEKGKEIEFKGTRKF